MKKIFLVILLIIGCVTATPQPIQMPSAVEYNINKYNECLDNFTNSMILTQASADEIADGAIGECEHYFNASWQALREYAFSRTLAIDSYIVDEKFGTIQYNQKIATSRRTIIAKVLKKRNQSTDKLK